MRRLALSMWCASLLVPAVALGHGAPPVSEQIVLRGSTLVVPTLYWGVFFGQAGGPWRWICEEAINQDQARTWALAGSGAYHVTNFAGVTSSRDGGCTWVAATGDLATRATAGVVADPVAPSRAFATTSSPTSDAPWNALFVTDDDGVTWTPLFQADELLRPPAVSSDGQTIYVVGASRSSMSPSLALHASTDGGKTFSSLPIAFSVDGAAQSVIDPLAVDPADATTLYLAVRATSTEVLVTARVQGGTATLVEQFRQDAAIGGVAFDSATQAVLVPLAPRGTSSPASGLMRSVAGGPWQPFSDLHQAQCVTVASGGDVYACSSEFAPDAKAIARSTDGGAHFDELFQYDQTVGPTTDCAPTTPVGQLCPQIWLQYAYQLGVGSSTGSDGGATSPDLGATSTSGSSGCAIAGAGGNPGTRASEHSPGWPSWLAVLGALAFVARLGSTRRRSPHGDAGGSSTTPSE